MIHKSLDKRKEQILAAVVEDYIAYAEPVGSKLLVERHHLPMSSATARGELAALEAMGFLTHTHTSSGRQPTEEGYRYYVNNVMKAGEVAISEAPSIAKAYTALGKQLDQLLRYTSEVLSDLTRCVSIVVAPTWRVEKIKHIDLLPIDEDALLVVLITRSGLVAKHFFTPTQRLTDESWALVESVMNTALEGLTAKEVDRVRSRPDRLLDTLSGEQALAVMEVAREISSYLRATGAEEIYSSGAANLLIHPEFGAAEKISQFLQMVEDGWRVLGMLTEMAESYNIWVGIGSENKWLRLDDFSLVAGGYQIGGRTAGTVTILGPTRMDYARAIAAVGLAAENLSMALSSMAEDGC